MNLARSTRCRLLRPTAAIVVALIVLGLLSAPANASASSTGWVLPVGPSGGRADVVHEFDPPEQRWHSGHRGVDLAAAEGAEVRAAGSGTVSYAGLLAGLGVVVIQHGTLRTTYQPVTASVRVGAVVNSGDPIGTLSGVGSHCAPKACLHWGVVEGDRYVNPLSLITSTRVRLLPLGNRSITGDPPPASAGRIAWPVAAPFVTSPYGMRVHPVTGVYKLHDGTDFRAPCGTPVRASAAGRVTRAGAHGSYGNQVAIDHGVLGGLALRTSYGHLSSMAVSTGQFVAAGQLIGRSGTTGSSTGCHLHFMVDAAGAPADPMRWLPWSTLLGSSSRMGLLVRPAQPIHRHMRVDLGRRERGVAEQLLDTSQVGPALEQMGGGRVA
jgi:murein DD-endopeptidase MepM/ murein hydrolase activator NlpD